MPNSHITLQSGLQSAVQLLGQGEAQRALETLEALVRTHGNHPDILQIRGVAMKRLGRHADAIASFQASLALNERQPHVHNNLGGALALTGHAADAEEHYRRAIALKPDYSEARYNLALLVMVGDPDAARTLLQQVNSSAPAFGPAWEALSMVLGKLGDRAGSLAAARRGATLSPQSHTAHHNLAQAAMETGDYAAAEAAYRASVALKPQSDAGWAGLGNALRHQERIDDAIAAMERAVAANPSNVDAHRALNELLWQTGRGERYLQSFAHGIAVATNDSALRAAFAQELLRIRRADDALRVLEPVGPHHPQAAQADDLRARAYGILGDVTRALAHHGLAVSRAPGDTLIARNHVETLLKSGRHDEALSACETSLAAAPLDQGMLAMFTTALRLNHDDRVHRLADFQSLARVFVLEPPSGFASIESFNLALAEELRKLHTTRYHPTDQTLRGGTQTFGALFERREPMVQLLRGQLEKAIVRYIADMGEDESHPLFARRARDFAFSGSWSVRLSEGGFHTNHFHPMGWISSAYYVTVPEASRDSTSRAGWFKLGETNLELGEHERIERYVQAQPGHLVLFPSYFWHGTVPFNTRSERITVAFDVVPVA